MSIFSIFVLLIIFVCFLLVLVIMVQNPKGGGLSSSFGGGGQQMGGVQKTTDFLDRSTWILSTFKCFQKHIREHSGKLAGGGRREFNPCRYLKTALNATTSCRPHLAFCARHPRTFTTRSPFFHIWRPSEKSAQKNSRHLGGRWFE